MSGVPLAPVVEHLPAGIVHVALPTPFPVGPVNCYVLLEDPVTVVDPGMIWADSAQLIEAARTEQGYASAEGHAALYCLIGWVHGQLHARGRTGEIVPGEKPLE